MYFDIHRVCTINPEAVTTLWPAAASLREILKVQPSMPLWCSQMFQTTVTVFRSATVRDVLSLHENATTGISAELRETKSCFCGKQWPQQIRPGRLCSTLYGLGGLQGSGGPSHCCIPSSNVAHKNVNIMFPSVSAWSSEGHGVNVSHPFLWPNIINIFISHSYWQIIQVRACDVMLTLETNNVFVSVQIFKIV